MTNALVEILADQDGPLPYFYRSNAATTFLLFPQGPKTYNHKTSTLVNFSPRRGIAFGDGYIGGVIPGVVTVDGSPAARPLDLRIRDGARTLISTTLSSPINGTYRFDTLDPLLTYDVIARDEPNRFYEDVIVGNIRPWTDHRIIAHGLPMPAFAPEYSFTRTYELTGGTLPYSVDLVNSDIPTGTTAVINGRKLDIAVSSYPDYDINIRVIDAGSLNLDIGMPLEIDILEQFDNWTIETDEFEIRRLRTPAVSSGWIGTKMVSKGRQSIVFDMVIDSHSYDYLVLYVNGVQIVTITGNDSLSRVVHLEYGDTVEFYFYKYNITYYSGGQNAAFVYAAPYSPS